MLTKIRKFRQVLSKIPQIKFHENPFGGSRPVPLRCTDRLVVIRLAEKKRLNLHRLVGKVHVDILA
jgi:hypothetical protein